MSVRVSAIIFQLFKVIMFQKCLTILELNWNQRLGHKKTNLNICHHMLSSSTRLQNRSFHVVERTRTSTKCQKCTCKACKTTVFHCQILQISGVLLPSSSWLLKLSIVWSTQTTEYWKFSFLPPSRSHQCISRRVRTHFPRSDLE